MATHCREGRPNSVLTLAVLLLFLWSVCFKGSLKEIDFIVGYFTYHEMHTFRM